MTALKGVTNVRNLPILASFDTVLIVQDNISNTQSLQAVFKCLPDIFRITLQSLNLSVRQSCTFSRGRLFRA